MKEFSATQAKDHWGEVLDAAQSGPVRIAKQKRPVAVVISFHQYEALRKTCLDSVKRDLDLALAKGKGQEQAVEYFHKYLGLLMQDEDESFSDLDIPSILEKLSKKKSTK